MFSRPLLKMTWLTVLAIAALVFFTRPAYAQQSWPTESTLAATDVTDSSATLNGSLISLGLNYLGNPYPSATVHFEYGPTTSLGSFTPDQTMTATGRFSAPVSGLAPSRTYYFKAVASGPGQEFPPGDGTLSFRTAAAVVAPVVATSSASSISSSSATLNGNLTSLGRGSSVSVHFEYGTTTGYGLSTSDQMAGKTGPFSAGIGSLSPGTTYHFRAVATYTVSGKPASVFGTDVAFTTGFDAPVVATGVASSTTTNSAELNGSLTSLGSSSSVDVRFEYGSTTGYGYVTSYQTVSKTGTFRAAISGLSPGSTYHFRAVATSKQDTVTGVDMSFTTSVEGVAAPKLVSPPSGSSGVPLTPTFTWESVRGADRYELSILTASSDDVYYNESIYATSFDLPSGYLKQGEAYTWTVRAHTNAGWSPYSEEWQFAPPPKRSWLPWIIALGALALATTIVAATPAARNRLGRRIRKGARGERSMKQAEAPVAAIDLPARYVNTCFTRGSSHKVVSRDASLGINASYDLRIDIGALSSDSVVVNAPDHPFPDRLLPPTPTGHWLEIAAVSDDFSVDAGSRDMFLPAEGAAWVCGCDRSGPHVCTEATRERYLYLPVKTPEKTGQAHLRMCVYFQKNLIQSQAFTCEVAADEKKGQGYKSEIDYTLTSNLNDVDSFPVRTANILVNENTDGTHKLIINGRDSHFHFNLTTDQMTKAMVSVREQMERVQFRKTASGTEYLLHDDNRKDKQDMIEDMKRLAQLGWRLYSSILALHAKAEEMTWLRDPASIQISRIGGSNFVFPWNFLYEYYLEKDAEYVVCPSLREWDGKTLLEKSETSRCPHETEHGANNKNTLCPYGFWGFRHDLEQPPSQARVRRSVQATSHPFTMAVAYSSRLDRSLTETHWARLKESMPGFAVSRFSEKEEFGKALAESVDVVYFYCHGKHETAGGLDTYLEIGDGSTIEASDITGWQLTDWSATPDHWKDSAPLVFINGCHTLDVTPASWANFVDSFAGVDAAGVIGTEIIISQQVAGEASEEFFRRFGSNRTAGEAMQSMRWHFLSKGNLLGLAYTAYCSSLLTLASV